LFPDSRQLVGLVEEMEEECGIAGTVDYLNCVIYWLLGFWLSITALEVTRPPDLGFSRPDRFEKQGRRYRSPRIAAKGGCPLPSDLFGKPPQRRMAYNINSVPRCLLSYKPSHALISCASA
jgi:hypothetical protein